MSESRKRNRKRYGGFEHKRAKSTQELDVGVQGVLVTCNMEEKQCTREALNLLNEYADALYGPPPEGALEKEPAEDEDAESALEREVSQLKWSMKWSLQRFHAQQSGAFNVVFIRSQGVDPVELVHRIFSDLERSKQSKARAILRMIPVSMTCRAYPDDMERALSVFLQPWFQAPQRATYHICFKSRNSNHLHRDDVISDVAVLVAKLNPENKVDLKNPELSINIEVIKNICCVSVLSDYFRFRKYNLQEVVKQRSNQNAEIAEENSASQEPTNETSASQEEEEATKSEESTNRLSGSEATANENSVLEGTASESEGAQGEATHETANQKTDSQNGSDGGGA